MMMTTTPSNDDIGKHHHNNLNDKLGMDYEEHHHHTSSLNHQVHHRSFINDPNDWKLKLVSGQLDDEDLINTHIHSDDEGLHSDQQLRMDDDSDDDAFFGGRQRNSQTLVTHLKVHDLDSSSSDEEDVDNEKSVDFRSKSPSKSPRKKRSFRMGQEEDDDDGENEINPPSFRHVNSIRIHHPFYQKYGDCSTVEESGIDHQQEEPIIQQQSITSSSTPTVEESNHSRSTKGTTSTTTAWATTNHLPLIPHQQEEQLLTTESTTSNVLISEESESPSSNGITAKSITAEPLLQKSQQVMSPTTITEVETNQQPTTSNGDDNSEDHHHFEIVTTTIIENNNSTVQYSTTTVPPPVGTAVSNLSNQTSINPFVAENDNNYVLQQALKYSTTVFDNSTEYMEESFTKMESPFANTGPKRSIFDPSTRVRPSQKKRVRFADSVILFPITYISTSPREENQLSQRNIPQPPPQQQFSIVTTTSSPISSTTNTTITSQATTTETASTNVPPSKKENTSTSPHQSTTLQKSVSFNFPSSSKQDEKKNGTIPSNYSNEDDNSRNPNDNNEDDEFRTNDGKRRFWGLTGYQYLVLSSAWLGWAFDIFDGVLFSYAAPICIPNLLGFPDDQITSKAAKEQTALWSSILSTVLLFGWGCGGVFFGWLTDKVGRSKTMMITIIVYSIGTFLAAFSFHISVLVILRFIASLGIGGEWSAGAALISETLPIEKRVIGGVLLYTAAPIGSMASFAVNYLITSVLLQTTTSPTINGTITNSTMLITDGIMSGDINAPVVTGGPIPLWLSWRILFAIGVVPTIVGIFVRLCVKEPDAWLEQKKREKEEEEEENNLEGIESEADLPQTPPHSNSSNTLSMVTASPAALETLKNEDSISLNSEDDLKEIDLNDQPVMPSIRSESEFSSTSSTPLKKKKRGSSYLDLFANADLRKKTISSILFVCPALISWWCISTFIPILSTHLASSVEDTTERKIIQNQYSVLGNMLFNFGGLIGTLLVIPVAMKFGRLWVYRIYFFCSTIFILVAFGIPDMSPYVRFCLMFPVGVFVFGAFGSFTFYLPELFPLELRGRGAGFTYNCGRFGTAIFPFFVGIMVSQGVNPLVVLACLSIATAAGFVVSVIPNFAVETKNLAIH